MSSFAFVLFLCPCTGQSTMQSLPLDVLRLIPEHLDKSSLWSFARTCSDIYTLCRPSLFEEVKLSVHLSEVGELDLQQIDRHKNVLAGLYKQQSIGSIVRSLEVIFEGSSDDFRVDPVDAGVLKALTAFLETTPQLSRLLLADVPCKPVARQASPLCRIRAAFQQSMLQLKYLQELGFQAITLAPASDSSWWLEVLLPAIPTSVRVLQLAVDFSHFAELEGLLARLEAKYTSSVSKLLYTCPQMGRACDQVLAFLIRSSPSLQTIRIGAQYLSDANAIELFSPHRTHENLYLDTVDVPHLASCRIGLQQQLHLRHLTVDPGSDFLYYFACLPPGLISLKLWITISSATSQDTEVSISLESALSAVKPCLEPTTWCPNLGELQIHLLSTSEEEDEYREQFEAARVMRQMLLEILQQRKVVPQTNHDFWELS